MPKNNQIFCSDIAREHGVPLIASATEGGLWFLVEYSGSYENKAVEESGIPDEVKDYLREVEIPGARTRVQLIQQDGSKEREGLYFFAARADSQNPQLYEYHLEEYGEILDIDLDALTAGQPSDHPNLRAEPVFLVCTNGRRDLCCARYGPAVYQAMAEDVGDAAWQSSHIGGHNKAPNNLFFPHGVNYGHATPEEILHLMDEYKHSRVVLNNYRGRVCYYPHIQAAEHFWRLETGVLDLPGMEVVSVADAGENQWRVKIQGADGANQLQIGVERRESDVQIRNSCLKEATSPVVTFHRVG